MNTRLEVKESHPELDSESNIDKSNIAIKVENLTKTYKLYDSPADRLKEALHWRGKEYHKDFHALNDVSFEIKKGETVGIIGKNGSGKSTLLKIITGVLSPTSGKVTVNGRVSALLELGAGFNPEYTGMENIYFQGNLMGYSNEEMVNKVDAIVEFADIGDFINQPVKSYSSGMFARLAFAVAINVEPDILIVDEALSVGDAVFQRKCFAKFKELRGKKTTILFVSHDLDSIKIFTQRSLFLKNGELIAFMNSQEVVIRYLKDIFGEKSLDTIVQEEVDQSQQLAKNGLWFNKRQSKLNFGKGFADFKYISIEGLNSNIFHGNEDIKINYEVVWNLNKINSEMITFNLQKNIIIGIHLVDKKNNTIFGLNTYLSNIFINPDDSKVAHTIMFSMPELQPGDYFLTAAIAYGSHENHIQLCWYDDAFELKCTLKNSQYVIGHLNIPYQIIDVTKDLNNEL